MLMWSSTSIRRGILFNIHAEYSACPRLLVSVLAIYATTFRPMFPWKILCLTQPETQKILLTHIPHVCNGPPLQICARDTSARDSLAHVHTHTYTHTTRTQHMCLFHYHCKRYISAGFTDSRTHTHIHTPHTRRTCVYSSLTVRDTSAKDSLLLSHLQEPQRAHYSGSQDLGSPVPKNLAVPEDSHVRSANVDRALAPTTR